MIECAQISQRDIVNMRLTIINDFEERFKALEEKFMEQLGQNISKKKFLENKSFLLDMNRMTKDKIQN